MKDLKNNIINMRGITLISLVITIVVLIILATVAINLSLGNNGIFNRAKTAKEQYQNAQAYEETEIAKITNKIDEFIIGDREDMQSSIIADFIPEIVAINGTYVTVKVPDFVIEKSTGYVYIINERVKKVTSDSEITIENLSLDTKYRIKICAIDETCKFKMSSEKIQKTEDKQYIIKNGEALKEFTNGNIASTEKKDGYIHVESQNTTARSAYYVDNVNLVGFTKVVADLEVTESPDGSDLSFDLLEKNNNPITTNKSAIANVMICENSDSSMSRNTYTLNFSNLEEGLLNFGKGARSGNKKFVFNIFNLYLQ